MEIPPLSSIECVDALWRLGFKIVDANDRRVRLQRDSDGRRVSVTRHKVLSNEEVRVILLVAGVDVPEFVQILARRAESSGGAAPAEIITGIRARDPRATRARARTGD